MNTQKIQPRSFELRFPEQFTPEHQHVIDHYQESFRMIDEYSPDNYYQIVDGAGRFMAVSPGWSNLWGFESSEAMLGRYMHEMPHDASKDAPVWIQGNQQLILSGDPERVLSGVDIYFFGSEKLLLFTDKRLLVDDASSSILGVALDVKVFYFNPKLFYHNRLLEFINYFNLCGSVTFSTDGVQSHPATDLTLYQQEICFLSLLNWSVAEMEGYFKSHENPFHRRGASVGAINMARQMITKKLGCLTPSEECFNQSLKEQGLHCILPLSLFANPYLSILREVP